MHSIFLTNLIEEMKDKDTSEQIFLKSTYVQAEDREY